jgi:hypothetical protein
MNRADIKRTAAVIEDRCKWQPEAVRVVIIEDALITAISNERQAIIHNLRREATLLLQTVEGEDPGPTKELREFAAREINRIADTFLIGIER